MITRRRMLQGAAASLLAVPLIAHSRSARIADARIRIAATWRGPKADDAYEAGIIAIDAEARRIDIEWSAQLPGRAHGLHAFADGSFATIAVRPGRWISRFDSKGAVIANASESIDASRHLNGHAVASADGEVLYTGETDSRDDSGWIAARDARTLKTRALWSTQGIEPHDIVLLDDQLIVANGGIRRTANDKKRELDRMESSLVRIDAHTGACTGQWRLDDRRLSFRHLAVAKRTEDPTPLIGIGIQAEHDAPEQRDQAPALALWDGRELRIPTHAADAAGYAGDIAASIGGGFVLSNPRHHKAWWWHPAMPTRLTNVAQLTEVNALESVRAFESTDCVAIAAARGVAIWHPTLPATMLPWPKPMVLDNHWCEVSSSHVVGA